MHAITAPTFILCDAWIRRRLRVPLLQTGSGRGGIYSGLVLDLSNLDLEEIANALADQTDYEHRWLINPQDRKTHV